MERHKIEPHKKTIFTKQFFIYLAKEYGLNAAIFEQLGSGCDTEIVVDNDTLKMLVKLQEQFAQLEEMGDNEYRGFYIELPRPTQEEWGDCEASIADGEYESTEEYLRDWELSNPRETVWYHISSARYRENRTIQFTDGKHSYFTIANYSRYINRVGNNFPNEWQRDFLAKLTLYFHKLIDTIIQDPEELNYYVANHLFSALSVWRPYISLIIPLKLSSTSLKSLSSSLASLFKLLYRGSIW